MTSAEPPPPAELSASSATKEDMSEYVMQPFEPLLPMALRSWCVSLLPRNMPMDDKPTYSGSECNK
jgi:hypothetical protein